MMTRLLLVAAALAGSFGVAPAAQACELQYCWWAQPVCEHVRCADPIPPYCINTTEGYICL